MGTNDMTRRAALISVGAFASAAASGCNTTQTAAVSPAASGLRIGAINVDTTPLIAYVGNPTAGWAQQALPGALAQAFAAHMAPGDASASTLSVRINTLYLAGGGPADPDSMTGVATLSGGSAAARAISVHATSTYIANPTDQALPEQALQGRVQALAQAFAYWLRRKLRA